MTVQIAKRSELRTFKVMLKRGVVERSFAWLQKNRRLWKNCERLLNTQPAVHSHGVRGPAFKKILNTLSGAALATVSGVLTEVPVMLAVIAVVNRTQRWYGAG